MIETRGKYLKALSLYFLCITLAAVANAGVLTAEGSITLGLPAKANTGNCDPFGCAEFFGLEAYQQVYSSAAFSGPVAIDEITFFDTVVHNGGEPDSGNYTLSFSYTAMPLDGLDLTNATNDITSGSQAFFSGDLPALSGNELSFQGTPFIYNPADGNLLLTVTVSNSSDNYPPLYLDEAGSTGQTTNAYFGAYLGQAISGGNDIGGLVTQFSDNAPPGPPGSVPEPASWLLLLSGLALGGIARAVKRRHTAGR